MYFCIDVFFVELHLALAVYVQRATAFLIICSAFWQTRYNYPYLIPTRTTGPHSHSHFRPRADNRRRASPPPPPSSICRRRRLRPSAAKVLPSFRPSSLLLAHPPSACGRPSLLRRRPPPSACGRPLSPPPAALLPPHSTSPPLATSPSPPPPTTS